MEEFELNPALSECVPLITDLTPSQAKVIELAMSGYTSREIAKALNVSITTVKSHTQNAYIKTEVNKLNQLIALYREYYRTKG